MELELATVIRCQQTETRPAQSRTLLCCSENAAVSTNSHSGRFGTIRVHSAFQDYSIYILCIACFVRLLLQLEKVLVRMLRFEHTLPLEKRGAKRVDIELIE